MLINTLLVVLSFFISFVKIFAIDRVISISLLWRIPLTFIVIYLILMIIYWIISIIISIPINTDKTYTKYSRFYGKYFGTMMGYGCFLAGARVKTEGMNKLPNEKFLFVSNHKSNFDPMIEAAVMYRYPLAFISKKENFKIPLGHRYMTRCRYMALDRDNLRSGAIVTKNAADIISSGDASVGVFPEGTRNTTDSKLLEFKHGCFKSALWAKCPIVIATISGTENIHKRVLRRPSKIKFKIIDVIQYDDFKDMKTAEISEMVRNIIIKQL